MYKLAPALEDVNWLQHGKTGKNDVKITTNMEETEEEGLVTDGNQINQNATERLGINQIATDRLGINQIATDRLGINQIVAETHEINQNATARSERGNGGLINEQSETRQIGFNIVNSAAEELGSMTDKAEELEQNQQAVQAHEKNLKLLKFIKIEFCSSFTFLDELTLIVCLEEGKINRYTRDDVSSLDWTEDCRLQIEGASNVGSIDKNVYVLSNDKELYLLRRDFTDKQKLFDNDQRAEARIVTLEGVICAYFKDSQEI